MTSFELAGVVIGVIALALNGVGIVVGLRQLRSVRDQLAQSARTTVLDHARQRAQATINFYSDTLATRTEFRSVLPLDRDAAGVAETVDRARADVQVMKDLTGYLGMWELFATAANSGVTDRDIVNLVGGGRLKAIALNYREFIEWRREANDTPSLYCEILTLAESLPSPEESRRRLAAALDVGE